MVIWSKHARWVGTAGIVIAASLAACAGKWYLKAEARSVVGGGTVELHYDGKSIKAEELPDDTAVDLEFLDANSEPIPTGAQGVQEGDEVKVPDGALVVVVSGPSNVTSGCIGCTAAPQSPVGERAPGTFDTHFQRRWIHVETLVPDVDGSSALGNVLFRADARVPLKYTALDVYGLVRPILEGGAGVDLPIDPTGVPVEVLLFQRIHVDPLAVGSGSSSGSGGLLAAGHLARLGGLEFETMDVTSAFIEYDLVVQGYHVADSDILSTANHASAPNGWRLVRVTVPEVLLDYSATHANLDFELRVRTPEDSFASVIVRSMEASQ